MSTFDMTESIAPRSDQINAEDMLSGPRTVTITEVRRGSLEQPVEVVTAEFGPARPFKPSKTVRRIMVHAWGVDGGNYVGKRMTLYRDSTVRFGGQDVGGIRVSHLSDITKPLTVFLTVTRGKRAPFVVKPLAEPPRPVQPASTPTPDHTASLIAAMGANGLTEKATALAFLSQSVGRDVKASKELTPDEVALVLAELADAP